MKTIVDVMKGFDPIDGVDYLVFGVDSYDDLDDCTTIGSYRVNENGIITGEIDRFLTLDNDGLSIDQAREIMKKSGLAYIVGNDLGNNELFSDDYDNTSLNMSLATTENAERWNRAVAFIKANDLTVEEINLDRIGL